MSRPRAIGLLLGTKSANLNTALFPMKLRFPLLTAITAVALIISTPPALQAKSDAEQICVSVGRLLEEGHYTHQQLNAEMSQKFLRNYLELLDFSHLFFTQKDVDALTGKYGTALADDVLDRKSTRLNSSHVAISYAVFCLKKKKK